MGRGDREMRVRKVVWSFAVVLVLATMRISCDAAVLTTKIEDRVVDLQFTKPTDLKEILAECAKQAGVVLALDQNVGGNISLVLKGPVSSVMDNICTLEGCRWEIVDGNPPALLVRKKNSKS